MTPPPQSENLMFPNVLSLNSSSNKPYKVTNKIWFDKKCTLYLHTYCRNVLRAYNNDRNMYNRELLIKARCMCIKNQETVHETTGQQT